jgi:hypothetical protein
MSSFDPDNIHTILEKELENIRVETIEKTMIAEKSIGLCQLAFLELKEYVIQNGFSNM